MQPSEVFDRLQDTDFMIQGTDWELQKRYPPEDDGPHFWEWLSAIVRSNLICLDRASESPLEKAFFSSLVMAFLGSPIVFMGRSSGDIESHIAKLREDMESAYKDTRGNPNPNARGLFISMFSLGLYHNFHVALQPVFENFYGDGRSIRADALIWIPSNPLVKVIIECDGFEHHKEKSSFIQDRKRDRVFASKGYTVRRYSGPEIFASAFAVTVELHDYLVSSFDFGDKIRSKWEEAMQSK